MTPAPLTHDTFFESFVRLGPGSETVSRALAHWGAAVPGARVLEVGCGHGATARVLAEAGAALVVATDKSHACVQTTREATAGVGTVVTVAADGLALPFAPGSFDAVVAEGSLYTLGLRRALTSLGPYLRKGGRIAFTHFGWTRTRVPAPMRSFWEDGLPERFVRAEAYMVLLEHAGFRGLHLEPFPRSAWESYYAAVRARIPELEATYTDDASRALLGTLRQEIEIFDGGGLNFFAYFLIAGEKL